MSSISRRVIYTLIAAVLVLLLGMAALLDVSYYRHQRLEDSMIDLKRSLSQQENKIVELEEMLEGCDTLQRAMPATAPTITPNPPVAPMPIDTSWETQPSAAKSAYNPPAPSDW